MSCRIHLSKNALIINQRDPHVENVVATSLGPIATRATAPIRIGRFIKYGPRETRGRVSASPRPLKPTSLGGTPNAFVGPFPLHRAPARFFRDTARRSPASCYATLYAFPLSRSILLLSETFAYSPRYRAERENSRYNRNFFNDKEKNGGANLRLRSENGGRRRRRGGEGGGW